MNVMADPHEPAAGVPAAGQAPRPAAAAEPLLRLRGISKHFGAVQALYGVDLDLPAGQVTALCGDNGAGKSVLTKCIAGIHQPDEGEMFWEGRPVHIRTPGTRPRSVSRPSTRTSRWPTTWTSSRTCSLAGSA